MVKEEHKKTRKDKKIMDKSRVEYHVDERNKVVVATIRGCRGDAMDFINDRFVTNVRGAACFNVWSKDPRYAMNDTYRAVAKCNTEEDEFDIEKGKRIACAKLTDRYHASLNNRLRNCVVDFSKIMLNMDWYLFEREGKFTLEKI